MCKDRLSVNVRKHGALEVVKLEQDREERTWDVDKVSLDPVNAGSAMPS